MKHFQNPTLRAALLGLAATACLSAHAAEGSSPTWSVRAGVTHIAPQVKSGDLSPPSFQGTRVDIGSSTQAAGGITYHVDDNIRVDVPLSLPFTFEVEGAGAIDGVGKIGESKALPATVLLQYHFGQRGQQFRPYVGGGLTYAYFYDQKGSARLSGLTGGTPGSPTKLEVDSKLGATIQAGLNIELPENWYVDVAVLKTYLKTDGKLSSGQDIKLTLNPVTLMLGVGRRF